MSNQLNEVLRSDFLSFARKALRELDGTTIERAPYVELLATYLEDFADGSTQRLLINMPARHLKTMLSSVCLSAWILAHDPCAQIMIVTYGGELTETISRSIRKIVQSPWFKAVFKTRIAKGHAKATHFVTTSGGEVYATSFDGSLAGFGGGVVIVDDAHDPKDAAYPEQLKRTIDLFHSIVVNRLDNWKAGRIMVVGHRVSEDDLSADLLEEGGWRHLALPIIAPTDQTYKTAYGCWHRKKGELLRPTAYDLEYIERRRRRQVNPSFELYYQQGVEEQAERLTADHFPSFDPDDVRNLPFFVSVDPGTDEGDKRSYSVVQLWASNGRDHFLIRQVRKRCDFRDLVRITKHIARDHIGAPILIEKTANGPALLSAFKNFRRRVHAIVPHGPKTARFLRHYDKLLARSIHVPKDAEFAGDFIEEVIRFPRAPHDDQVDALTQFLDWIGKQDDFDFSRTNVVRSGLAAGGGNSAYVPVAPLRLNPKAPGLAAVASNSSYRGATWSGQPSFHGSRLNSPFRPQMPNLGEPWWARYCK